MTNLDFEPDQKPPIFANGDESTPTLAATAKEDETGAGTGTGTETEKGSEIKVDIEDQAVPVETPTTDEYPRGLSLGVIVLAIILAVFLIALDQVSTFDFLSSKIMFLHFYGLLLAQLFPKSPTNSTASTRSHGTVRRTS